ncbi:MAG: zinc-binding alcohol dehydrogenase family protein [Sphingobacteriales bacterium]|nr:MAG: zinc-binding alcohol dehydrogenase family protein [Sphingobacteriales bacterium]
MQSLICKTPGEFIYVNQEKPKLKAGHTLLKIKQIGLCGTDYHAFEGNQPFFNYPRILGHEIAAEIAETTQLSEFHVGELVTVSPYYYCGECIACRSGKTNCCVAMKVCGVHVDGALTEYLLVPDYAIIKAVGLSADELVLVEPLAIGAHGVSRAKITPGEFVLVIGAGPIGVGTMNFAKIAGANLIAIDINEQRLSFCREYLQIAYTINPLTENVLDKLKEITLCDMPTVVIDCTGNRNAIIAAFQYMAHGARFVLIGLQNNALEFSHLEFHKREGTLMSSRNALPEDFEFVIANIKNGNINSSHYITHRINFRDIKDKFSELSADGNVIKAVISF